MVRSPRARVIISSRFISVSSAFHEKVAEDVALVVLAERRRRAPQTVCALRTGACVVPGREPGPGKKLRVKGGGRADCPFLPVAVHGMDIVPFFPQIGDHLPPLFFEEGAQRTAEAGAGEYPGKKVKGRFIALCDRPFEVDLDDPLLEGRRPLQKQPAPPVRYYAPGRPGFLGKVKRLEQGYPVIDAPGRSRRCPPAGSCRTVLRGALRAPPRNTVLFPNMAPCRRGLLPT